MFNLGPTLGATQVAAWTSALAETDLHADPTAMIEEVRALEELACAARARQARLVAAFDAAEHASQAAAGVPAARQDQGVAHQVALARRESPHRGRQHVLLARILPELPHTGHWIRIA